MKRRVLRELAEAGGSLTFTELRRRGHGRAAVNKLARLEMVLIIDGRKPWFAVVHLTEAGSRELKQ